MRGMPRRRRTAVEWRMLAVVSEKTNTPHTWDGESCRRLPLHLDFWDLLYSLPPSAIPSPAPLSLPSAIPLSPPSCLRSVLSPALPPSPPAITPPRAMCSVEDDCAGG